MKHIKQTILPFVFASGLLASTFAQAAQLGKLEVLSGAGEPFLAQIQIDLVTPEERASLQAKLASAEAFKAARLTMDPNLKNLKFVIQDGKQAGTALVKITADKPLPAGFIDTLVELTWAGGRVAREYTLTIPLGPAPEEKPASTALPEIRPPMTPPAAAVVPPAGEPASKAPPAPTVSQDAPVDSKTGTLQVKRGDTLSELAMELVGDGVSLNQAMAAIYEANKDSFINGSVHLIREGAQIQVPNRTALRAKSANEALLVLANNDDRNVYSAYARQIGLLTVENQTAAASTTSTQGSISPKQKPETNTSAREDRLQIAPSASTSAGKADLNAEELLAKNKALAEANAYGKVVEADIEDGPWPFSGQTFDVVLVTNYLWRPLMPRILECLKPEGLLIYETFALGHEKFGKPSRPDFLLKPGELLQTCAQLHVIAYENGYWDQPAKCVQRIAAAQKVNDLPHPFWLSSR